MNQGNTTRTQNTAAERPTHERIVANGTGVLKEIEVMSGAGRQTTDRLQVLIRAEDGTETLMRSALLPAQRGVRTLPNLAFTGALVARGNLQNLTFRGEMEGGTTWEHALGSAEEIAAFDADQAEWRAKQEAARAAEGEGAGEVSDTVVECDEHDLPL